EGEGPKFERPVRSAADIARLGVPDMEGELRYVTDAVRVIRRELHGAVPLIGFSGSPWTLACYMVEGGGSRDFARIKAMALNDPQALHALLSVNTDAVIAYLAAQRAAGAQALQVFDTWGGVLSPAMYREFSLPYLQRIARELERGEGAERTPLIIFGRGNGAYLEDLAGSGAEGVGVDWLVELGEAARRTGRRVAVQGNLDPATLYGSPEAVRREVRRALDSWRDGNGGSREGHVFNLGHGMSPDMDPEHVAVLVDEVHAYSARWGAAPTPGVRHLQWGAGPSLAERSHSAPAPRSAAFNAAVVVPGGHPSIPDTTAHSRMWKRGVAQCSKNGKPSRRSATRIGRSPFARAQRPSFRKSAMRSLGDRQRPMDCDPATRVRVRPDVFDRARLPRHPGSGRGCASSDHSSPCHAA